MNESKRITLGVRINVAVEVDAERDESGEVQVVKVVRLIGLPTASDVMEALVADDDFAQLDEEFDNA